MCCAFDVSPISEGFSEENIGKTATDPSQVYNDRVYDLLSPGVSKHRPLPILASARQGKTAGRCVEGCCEDNAEGNSDASAVVVGKRRSSSSSSSCREGDGGSRLVGLSAHTVESAEEVMELLRQGARNRRVRATEVCAL